jgi:hypothetical protein
MFEPQVASKQWAAMRAGAPPPTDRLISFRQFMELASPGSSRNQNWETYIRVFKVSFTFVDLPHVGSCMYPVKSQRGVWVCFGLTSAPSC